jgi:O-antigen/teichoic acid export membrane protein
VDLSYQKVKGTLFNFACRSGGLLAKFLLIIYISKAMSFETLGLFNIISVTVAWSVYVLGFEFYSYSLRQIVGEHTSIVSRHVFNQLIFHLTGYLLLLVCSPILVAFDFIPVALLHYFILITIFDQLSQEYFRICVALERSQFANFIHFVKSGLWVYPLLLLPMFQIPIDIHMILVAWLIGTVGAFALGTFKLIRLRILSFKNTSLDILWIKKGIVVAMPFLVISVAQLTMDFSDRYLIDHFLGKSEVGIYGFYYGIANVPTTLITSVLLAQYYPRIINIFKFETSLANRKKTIRQFLFQCLGFAVVINVIILLSIPLLLEFIGKQELMDHFSLFYIMLLQVLVFSIQVVVQTILYARHEDKFLLYSAVAGAVLNIIVNLYLIPSMGINGAAISTLLSMTLMLLVRLYFLRKSHYSNGKYGTV